MTTDTTYNGWKNYETWCVNLWNDNEQGSHDHWRAEAKAALSECEGTENWTRAEQARFRLADQMKETYEEAMPEVEGVWADLLRAALSEVHWDEIAGSLINEALDEEG